MRGVFGDVLYNVRHFLHRMKNIDKMIHYDDPSSGGAMYACTRCGKLKFVLFRCNSCFCPTCGNKYSMERITSMSFKLLNYLFHSVNSVISRIFYNINKSKNFIMIEIAIRFFIMSTFCPLCDIDNIIRIFRTHCMRFNIVSIAKND